MPLKDKKWEEGRQCLQHCMTVDILLLLCNQKLYLICVWQHNILIWARDNQSKAKYQAKCWSNVWDPNKCKGCNVYYVPHKDRNREEDRQRLQHSLSVDILLFLWTDHFCSQSSFWLKTIFSFAYGNTKWSRSQNGLDQSVCWHLLSDEKYSYIFYQKNSSFWSKISPPSCVPIWSFAYGNTLWAIENIFWTDH